MNFSTEYAYSISKRRFFSLNERESYTLFSVELHLFSLRILKEEMLFLFILTSSDIWISYMKKFEALLWETLSISQELIPSDLIHSGELVTKHTLYCESNLPVDHALTKKELLLTPSCSSKISLEDSQSVKDLNLKTLVLLHPLIVFLSLGTSKTQEIALFIHSVLKEAYSYHSLLLCLENDSCTSYRRKLKELSFLSLPFEEKVNCMPLYVDHMLRKAKHHFRII